MDTNQEMYQTNVENIYVVNKKTISTLSSTTTVRLDI